MKYLMMLILLIVVSCAKDPVESKRTGNNDITLDLLFKNDGCSVYRFYDAGRYRYFSDCRGDINTNGSCGKNCYIDNQTMNSGR